MSDGTIDLLKGILPAVVTPFDQDANFAEGEFECLLERLYQRGVHGVYVCGHTGEGWLQSVGQRKKVAEAAVKCSPPGKSVIVHVGSQRTDEALELAKHASRIHAQAISSLPPAGGYSFKEIRAYYEKVAAVSEIPVLVYYFPEVSPAVATVAQALDLCQIPNVIGLKFSDFDVYKLSILRRRGAVIFNGRDEVLAAGLLMGADGGIGSFYNLVPELFVRLYELTRTERWSEAREIQETVNELIESVLRYPCFPAIKKILSWTGIECGDCLAPRGPLTHQEESDLRACLLKTRVAHLAALEEATP